jgi:hypothetical protein
MDRRKKVSWKEEEEERKQNQSNRAASVDNYIKLQVILHPAYLSGKCHHHRETESEEQQGHLAIACIEPDQRTHSEEEQGDKRRETKKPWEIGTVPGEKAKKLKEQEQDIDEQGQDHCEQAPYPGARPVCISHAILLCWPPPCLLTRGVQRSPLQ